MRRRRGELPHRQRHDLGQRHGAVARQPLVLGRDLAGLVGELPGRIGKQRGEAAASGEAYQILVDGGHVRRFAALQEDMFGEQRSWTIQSRIDSTEIRLGALGSRRSGNSCKCARGQNSECDSVAPPLTAANPAIRPRAR